MKGPKGVGQSRDEEQITRQIEAFRDKLTQQPSEEMAVNAARQQILGVLRVLLNERYSEFGRPLKPIRPRTGKEFPMRDRPFSDDGPSLDEYVSGQGRGRSGRSWSEHDEYFG